MSETRLPAPAYSVGGGDPVPRQRRNSRRAYDHDGRECWPMDLAYAAQNGIRVIWAICPPRCRYEGEVAIDRFPTTMAVRDVGLHQRCSVCGRKGPETVPVWLAKGHGPAPAFALDDLPDRHAADFTRPIPVAEGPLEHDPVGIDAPFRPCADHQHAVDLDLERAVGRVDSDQLRGGPPKSLRLTAEMK